MRILDSEETAALLPYGALADSLRQVLRDKRAGNAHAPERLVVPLPGGASLLAMPAADDQLAVTKLVTVHPQNSEGGKLPVVQAEVLVMDAVTGMRLLMLEGKTVTARRTAALSLLAARLLAPEPSGPLLVIGAGAQARSHLEAFVEWLGVREVYAASRTLAHAEELAAYARQLGTEARAIDLADGVPSDVKLVVTATTSARPVLATELGNHAFIAAVGAYLPEMAELPHELVRRSRVYVDTLEGAQAGAGDLIQAGVDWSRVTPLENALERPKPRGGPVVFKSVGHALWDLAAARLAAREARLADQQ